jgi:hypothetical protein
LARRLLREETSIRKDSTPTEFLWRFREAPLDPEVMAGVALLLLTVALAANYIPACRSTRIDEIKNDRGPATRVSRAILSAEEADGQESLRERR